MRVRAIVLGAALVVFPAFAQAPSSPDPAEVMDSLWPTRDLPASMKALEETIREGLKAAPNDYALLWRAARYRWFVADGLTDEKLKRQLAKEGWNYADRAHKANPAGAEARYYSALCIGAYSQAVGILKALSEGLEGQFNEHLDAACAANESFDRLGCHTARGRYFWELPWPKRDLEKSRGELKKVLERHPEVLRAWLYLADTELKDGHLAEAKVAIDRALVGAGEYDAPEARRIKAWAKERSTRIDAAK